MNRLLVAASLLGFIPGVSHADCRSIYDSELNEVAWSEMRESRYTLCYDTRFAQDVELAERWVNNAFDIAERKYKVVPPVQRRGHDLEITIFLVPHPTSRANRSTATVTCCSDSVSLEIHIMSPSAPEYGRPEDDFIKTLTHEMMNSLHYETREPPNTTPPRWLLEGLAEYEGYYGTTPGNRAKVDWLIGYVYDNLQGDVLYGYSLEDSSSPTIVSVDRYYASAAVMIFFAERFGEEIHYKFFERPINDVLTDYGFGAEEAFRELDAWLDRKHLAPPAGTSGYTPHVTCTGRYWRTNSGELSFEARGPQQRPAARNPRGVSTAIPAGWFAPVDYEERRRLGVERQIGLGLFDAAVHEHVQPAVPMAGAVMPDGPDDRRYLFQLVQHDPLDGRDLRAAADRVIDAPPPKSRVSPLAEVTP